MDTDLEARLSERIGTAGVVTERGAAVPRTVEEVAAVCAVCGETATPISVTSGPPQATAPEGALRLSVAGLGGVDVHPGAGVARAGAGATLEAVAAAAATAGLFPVGVASADPGLRVGAAIARGRLPRRALCGIEAVLPGGETVDAGRPVLKDVAAYDVAGALLGSAGRLAVITAAWLRLEPAGARVAGFDPPGETRPGEASDLVRLAFDPAGLMRP